MVSTNTDVVLLHPGKFNMLNPKNGGLDQMMFLFNWIIFLCSILIFRSVSGLLSLFFFDVKDEAHNLQLFKLYRSNS